MESTKRHTRSWVGASALLTIASLALTGCGAGASQAEAGDGTGEIVVWAHQGQDSENAALQAAVDGFNSSQSDVSVTLKLLSQDSYTSTVANTPVDEMPDVLDVDGPTLASLAYDGRVAGLEDFVSSESIDNATDGSITEGTYDGTLYGLAQYDSALGLYGNKSLLDAAGVEYPTSTDEAWTAAEFADALDVLASANASGKALTMVDSALAQEWGTFAFSPIIQSAGATLIKDGTASGVLNTPEAVDALEQVASWKPFVDSDSDGNAFASGRVALSWSGHWNYPAYSEALGDDVIALPLPDFGHGTKTGAGSWVWSIGASTTNGAAAGAFIDYLLNDESVAAITEANGAPPATKSAFADAALYQDGGALALFGDQLKSACSAEEVTDDCIAVYRPATPGYPTITSAFASALAAVYGGGDAQENLDKAAQTIDQAYSDNNGYQ